MIEVRPEGKNTSDIVTRNKGLILEYLKNGECAPGDGCETDGRANGGSWLNDGVYVWSSDMISRFEQNGQALPDAFIRHVLMRIKRMQRRRCLDARRSLTAAERARFSERICQNILKLDEARSAKVILSYAATPDEVDLDQFNSRAEAEGKLVAYPYVLEDGGMEAAVPRDSQAWETGRFGIRTPAAAKSEFIPPEMIDLVIVPCAGFDAEGGRLGRGGGYYDRFLPRCPKADCVAVAFEAQKLERVARDENDHTVGAIVTELDCYRSGAE